MKVYFEAESLENAAKKGDATYVEQNHAAFNLLLENLLNAVREFLENEGA
jgi:hypothetical protein